MAVARAAWLLALVFGCWASSAHARSLRFLIAVSSNIGDPSDPPLRFANDDAARVAALFNQIGNVGSDRTYLVQDQPASVVRQKLAEVSGRIKEAASAGNEVVLLIYVSGHARTGELHLVGTHLPLAELQDFASDNRAQLRVLVVDACDSGMLARAKGASAAPTLDLRWEQQPLRGQVLVASSGAAEASQEWDSLGSSLFTYHWLTGLRGDADADVDGRVTLAEAYSYAYRQTLSKSARASQHPTFDFDLSGAGDLVLSQPAQSRSALVLGAGLSGRYVITSLPRPDVILEIDKVGGRPVRIAVPPGRYLVRKPMGAVVAMLTVELPYGGEGKVDESAFIRRPFSEVVFKGDSFELRNSVIFLQGSLATEPLQATGPRGRMGLGYMWKSSGAWLGGVLEAGWTRFRGVDLQVQEVSWRAVAQGGWRVPLWVGSLELGAQLGVMGARQQGVRDQEATIRDVLGLPSLPIRLGVGLEGGPCLGLEAPLVGNVLALAQLSAGVRWLPSLGQEVWSIGADARLGIGWRF